AGVLILHAYNAVHDLAGVVDETERPAQLAWFAKLMFATGALQATALFFGVFFIYPLIRTQVKEEGKLRAMTETLSARSLTLEHAALTDPLTGMHNRRFFDDALREYIKEFRRIQRPVGLLVLDLDHFKAVNDTHGHDVGDVALKAVATCHVGTTRHLYGATTPRADTLAYDAHVR